MRWEKNYLQRGLCQSLQHEFKWPPLKNILGVATVVRNTYMLVFDIKKKKKNLQIVHFQQLPHSSKLPFLLKQTIQKLK